VKELDDEKNRLQKTNAAQHTQLDKYKKMSDDRQSLADSLETQVSALNKACVHRSFYIVYIKLDEVFMILYFWHYMLLACIKQLNISGVCLNHPQQLSCAFISLFSLCHVFCSLQSKRESIESIVFATKR